LATGTQTLTIRAEDFAGNQTSISIQITFEPQVLFVRKGATGLGDGTSWANAFPDLGPILLAGKVYPGISQIWVSEGTYVSSVTGGFKMISNTSISGGFASEGTDRSLVARDLGNNVSFLQKHPDDIYAIVNTWTRPDGGSGTADTISLSDFQFSAGTENISFNEVIKINAAKNVTLKNISISLRKIHYGIAITDSRVDIIDSRLIGNTINNGAIDIYGDSKVRILNTEISNSQLQPGGYGGGLRIMGGEVCAGSKTIIRYNNPSEVLFNGTDGVFSREPDVTIGSGGISNGSNTIVSSCPAPF
jgi:hypothetical protein